MTLGHVFWLMCFLRNTLCYKVNTGTPVASLLDNNFPTCGIGRGEDKEGAYPLVVVTVVDTEEHATEI